MRICFVPASFDAPGCYRCFFPAAALRALGHEAAVPPFLELDAPQGEVSHAFQTSLAQMLAIDADVYVFHQQADRDAVWLIGELRRMGKLVVGECDDYFEGIPSYHSALRGSAASVNRTRNRDLIMAGLRACEALTVSTPFLAEAYGRFCRDVRVLPNFLHWEMWEGALPQHNVLRERMRVGWYGDMRMRAGDIRVIDGVIQPWLERHPDWDFVATTDTHEFLRIPHDRRVVIEGVQFRSWRLPEIVATMDIGLVPLEMNNFNEAKSHLKGLEYGACGIPCIASPTAPYRAYIDEGRDGFLAARPRDWLRALDFMAADDGRRREMGRAARKKARLNTIDRHAGLWVDAYTDMLEAGRDRRLALACSNRFGALQKPRELEAMLGRVRALRPARVLEIGSAHGGTLIGWSDCATTNAVLVSLDLPGGEFGGNAAEVGVAVDDKARTRVEKRLKPGQRVEWVRGDSHDPATLERVQKALGGPADFLFVDGDHTYDGVKADFEMYAPLVRPGGLVAFHDVLPHPSVPDCQVDRLWAEVKHGRRHWEFAERGDDRGWGQWGGIGVLEVAA